MPVHSGANKFFKVGRQILPTPFLWIDNEFDVVMKVVSGYRLSRVAAAPSGKNIGRMLPPWVPRFGFCHPFSWI